MDAFEAMRMPPGRWRPLAAAAGSFLLVLALRIQDPNLADGVGFLFVIPVALLALGYGLPGGIGGASLSLLAVVVLNVSQATSTITVMGYLSRGVAVFIVGSLLGWFADTRRSLEAQRASGYEDSLRSLERERARELGGAHSEALRLLAAAAEYRDDGAAQHTQRVAELSAQIAMRLGLNEIEVGRLGEAALLHDVGKLSLPDELLLKPGRLTDAERQTMAQHTTRGARLLEGSSSPVLRIAAQIAASHHEWWDGSGYPCGLAGEEIPLAGRIVAVADVFDALTHERPYKPAWPLAQAVATIRSGAGTQFEPRIVAAFLGTPAVLRAPLPPQLIAAGGELLALAEDRPRDSAERPSADGFLRGGALRAPRRPAAPAGRVAAEHASRQSSRQWPAAVGG